MRNLYDPRSFDHLVDEFDFAASLKRRPDFFLKHLPKRRRRALDVGCGTGTLAHELARHFDSVLAIDISEPMLAFARKKRSAPNLEYRRADANALELEGEFDAIVSHTTFHHLEDVGKTLATLRAALAPEGRIVIIDMVSEREASSRYVYASHAFVVFIPNIFYHGLRAAVRLFRFQTSRAWLDHLTTDCFLTEAGFREVYGQVLPGASFTRFKYFVGVVWQAPAK